MMMAGDPKKLAVMIVSAHKPSSYSDAKKHNEALDPKAPEGEESPKEEDEGLHSAAEEMMSALESKDVDGFVEALKDFISMCDEDYEQEEGSDE